MNSSKQKSDKLNLSEYLSRAAFWLTLAVGILLRVYRFAQVPAGYQMDEAYSAWNAYNLYHTGMDSAGRSFPVYFEAWGHGMNALNSYLMLPFLAANGGNMVPRVMRMPQLLVSIGSLIALYLLVKKLAGKELAFVSLFVLSIAPWHIMVSRWGLESQLLMGFLSMGLCLFVYGLERPRLLPLSALCYGLSLYCYATIWPILPIILVLQVFYCLFTHRLKCSAWMWGSVILLGVMALPLVGFLLVNMGYLKEFHIGVFSVYKMTKFRGNELAHSLQDVIDHYKKFLYLMRYQDVSRPYDVIMPYGFFYSTGVFFILIGLSASFVGAMKALFCDKSSRFSGYVLLWIQLLGAFLLAGMIPVGSMTQINCIYLPLIICEAIGIKTVVNGIAICVPRRKPSKAHRMVKVIPYFLLFVLSLYQAYGFVLEYFGNYATFVSAYFQSDTDVAIRYAKEVAPVYSGKVYVNSAIKYPNVALYTETDAAEYLQSVCYNPSDMPAASSFSSDGVTYYMGYDPAVLDPSSIYVIYYTEQELFKDYHLTAINDWWLVAEPSSAPTVP